MESLPVILVVDLGMTNCKALAFSAEGNIIGESVVAYPTHYPGVGLVEQDPDEWVAAVRQVIRSVLSEKPSLAEQIGTISVTGHMHALVGVDKDGKPVANAIVLGDQRSRESALWIKAEMGLEDIYHITGARMEESMPAAKIHWLKNHTPELFDAVHLFTGCKDFVRGWLTGDRLTDPIDACAMSLYDLSQGTWSPDLLKLVGITSGQLPEILPPFAQAGILQAEAAKQLGLSQGIPVAVGGGDDIVVLGAGLMTPGNSLEDLGTTGSFFTCANDLIFDPYMALEVYPHAEPGLWVIGGSITTAGAALAWAADLLGYGDVPAAFRNGINIRADDNAGTLIFVPHLAGERCPSWNPKARGVWVGLSVNHHQADLMRAAFHGIAHALNRILKRIDALVGSESQLVVALHEEDRLDWLQLRANVYGRSLGVLDIHEPTALGAMILGSVGIGVYPNLHEAVDAVKGVKQHMDTDINQREWLAQQASLYARVQEALHPIWEDMEDGNIETSTVDKQEVEAS